MKTVTAGVIILALCVAVILGTTVLEKGGQWQQARAIRQLDAQIAQSEAAQAEAENLPRAIAEEWAGMTEHAETIANLERDRATTDALIELALSDLRAEQQWRGYVQAMFALVLVSLIAGGALYLVHDATKENTRRASDAT